MVLTVVMVINLALHIHRKSCSIVVVYAVVQVSLRKVGLVVRESIDRHGVEQFLPPVVGAVLDVRVRRARL